jgi:hypothetical protein
MNHSVHDSKVSQDRHWQGQYFGRDGEIEASCHKYNLACEAYLEHFDDEEHKKNCTKATMGYLSTLYSALNHSLRQVLRGRMGYVQYLVEVLDDLDEILKEAINLYRQKELDAGEKEVLMAVLLTMRFIHPFSGYRALAISLGEEILVEFASSRIEISKEHHARVSNRVMVARSTYLLACARLSRALKRSEGEVYRLNVLTFIHDKEIQHELGWKTINRLARLIGDKELVAHSAKMDGSPDILLKSGM